MLDTEEMSVGEHDNWNSGFGKDDSHFRSEPVFQLIKIIYSMYADKKRRGITWTRRCITVEVRDAL